MTPYGQKSITDETPIDISHEALIRSWRSLADAENGWLRREFKEGLTWQSLRVRAEDFRRNPEQLLSPAETTFYAGLIQKLPSRSWCERYGGGWDSVQSLIEASKKEIEKQSKEREAKRRKVKRLVIVIALAFVISFLAMVIAVTVLSLKRAYGYAHKRHPQPFDSSFNYSGLLARGEDAEAREILRKMMAMDRSIPETRRYARNLLAGGVAILGGSANKVYKNVNAALSGDVAVSPTTTSSPP